MDNLTWAGLVVCCSLATLAVTLLWCAGWNAQQYLDAAQALNALAMNGTADSYSLNYCAMVMCSMAEERRWEISLGKEQGKLPTAHNLTMGVCDKIRADFFSGVAGGL